jgi:monofunctional biosynthetic peptidoglycan transglycosylase
VAAKAVVAAEDQKFWTHSGFDFDAMAEAHERNKKRSRKRGASTISQQTAKNLFLWPGGGYFRKGIEAWLTLLIEALWPKARILEVYLNIAEFGPGIYGVEAAAQRFFGKAAAKLSADEAARLAASLPRPSHWHAASGSGYASQRAGWILGQMGYRTRGQPPPAEPPEPEEDMDAPAQIANPLGDGPVPGVLTAPPAGTAPDDMPDPNDAAGPATPAADDSGFATYPLPQEGGQVVDEPVAGEAADEDTEDAEQEEDE